MSRKFSEREPGYAEFRALGHQVLVVFKRRVEGWAAYIGAVPGKDHDREAQSVLREGDKLPEDVATCS